MATAGVVIIGDEILSGKFADQNGAFLIAELRALGVELRRLDVIPDDRAEISATVKAHAARFDHVFTSGGVGPTHDDVTIEAIAAAFDVPVIRHPELERRVRAYWGAKLEPANLRLAEVPRGAELWWGKDTTWPVVSFANVVILPGVPELFRRKFVEIRERFRGEPVYVARLYVDADEGRLAPELDRVVAAFPAVKVGSYPRVAEREFRVLLTLECQALAAVQEAYDALASALGELVVRREPPQT
ncbi:MAG: competence/damage-inducible protein A [Myxococcales bacterium]|nr:competence/damage-inducible protein A [Myxococcales bacterium]